MKNKKGFSVLENEGFIGSQRHVHRVFSTDESWWAKPIVIILMTLSFTILDGIVLFDLFDNILLQNQMMGYLVSYGIALILNVIPLIVAKLIYQRRDGHPFSTLWIILSISVFLLLLSATSYLRFNYEELYLPVDYTLSSNVANPEVSGPTENELAGAHAIILLFCLSPLVTSVVNFLLCLFADDPLRKRDRALQIRECELREVITELEATLDEMKQDSSQMVVTEKKNYATERDAIIAWGNKLKSESRLALAMYLKSPEAISQLSTPREEIDTNIATFSTIADANEKVG